MSGAVAERIRRLWGSGTVSGLGEGALLERFVGRGDPLAFEAIVARHGPTVLAVCRRFLRDPHDVDDAFQATFLILVRKAGSLRRREALGAWLHGVAHRVAVRARSQALRRPGDGLASGQADGKSTAPEEEIEQAEAAVALHEELARLPAASSTTTVTVLLPVWSGIAAALQVASVVVPLNWAVPLPPRSLDQRTR